MSTSHVAAARRAAGRPAGTALLVALGSPDRGDDGVGAAVARLVQARCPSVHVVACADPTALIETWAGHDPVVVVDAVRSGAVAGTVHRLEVGAGTPPLPASSWTGSGRGSTHALGLATAVELARVLQRLPARLTLVGVEASGFDHGAPLTSEVAAAIEEAAGAALTALVQEGSRHVPG